MQSSGKGYLAGCCIKTLYLSQKHGGLVGSDVMLAPFPCGSLLLCRDHLEIRIVEFFLLAGTIYSWGNKDSVMLLLVAVCSQPFKHLVACVL